MRINGNLNKFEMLQNYYLYVKGIQISYEEALKLFNQLDYDTERDFIEYYAEEIGFTLLYETDVNGNLILDDNKNPIIKSFPFVSFSGYNLDVDVTPESLRICKKSAALISSTIEAYAVKNGIVLDPIWSQYSAEEIIRMENEGVLIPQEVLDIAHTIQESDTSNFEGGDDSENGDESTEKEPFLKLIPKAKKHIEKCEEKENQIDDKINDLMDENKQTQRSLTAKFEQQRASLKEYEEKVREWRSLQDKVNNGETLTDREARRYAEITGMLQDQNNNDSDFKMDKNKIALSLTDINILAVLGNQLALETIEIGDTLADYTSKSNYKATTKEASGEIGFLRAIIALIHGKSLAKESNKVGNETKAYTDETKDAVNDIAGILGIEDLIANPESGDTPENEKPGDVKTAESEGADKTGPSNDEQVPPNNDETENSESASKENDSKEEDFIINDKNVFELTKEAGEINIDLIKQIKQSLENMSIAVDDEKYAKFASKIIEKIVKEYQEEEIRRQEEIKTKEKEIADEKKEIAANGGNPEDPEQIKDDEIIQTNLKEIEALKAESEQAVEAFKLRVQKPKERIVKQLPAEMKALENDTEYKDNIIPADKERLHFTDSTGETLRKMGQYRVVVGMEQIATRILIRKGLINIAKGSASMGIGLTARLVANVPSPKIAEKSTEKALKSEDSAINLLDTMDVKISEITGEQTELEKYNESKESDEADDEDSPVDSTEEPPETSEPDETAEPEEPQEPQEPGVPPEDGIDTPDTPANAPDEFVVNDESVLGLIKEAVNIDADLAKQIKQSLENLNMAQGDKTFVKKVSKIIEAMIKSYEEEENKRQEEIAAKEKENEDAQKRIDELEGTKGKEEAKKLGINVKEDENSEDQKEIEEKRALIEQNNQDIEALKAESEQAKEEFKQKVLSPKSYIANQIPAETKALENDVAYKDEIIPVDKEAMKFTDESGTTLIEMGEKRVAKGLLQIASRVAIAQGIKNVTEGTISVGIGTSAKIIANVPTPEIAEKTTDKAVEDENDAIDGMNALDSRISEVTGEQTEKEKAENAEDNEGTEEGSEDNNPELLKPGENGVGASAPGQVVVEGPEAGDEATADDVEAPELEGAEPEGEINPEEPPQETPQESTGESGEDSDGGDSDSGNSSSGSSSGSSKSSGDNAGDVFSGKVLSSGKSDAKDAENVKKDTEKDEKQLLKETQILQRQMKRDEKQIIKMTKESLKAAKKQEEILVRYEELVNQNEEIAAQEDAKQMSGPSMIAQQMSQGTGAGMAQPQVTDSSQGSSADNQAVLQANDQEISVLGAQFDMHGAKIERNRNRILKLQKSTTKNMKTFTKKTKVREAKIKEAEKKEADRQKKLAKQLGVVGIGENIASITVSVGSILASYLATQPVGLAMIKWGTWALTLCGVTKAAINLANGNTTAALIGLGQTAITAVASLSGAGGAAQGVLGQVSAGLSVVSSSAELVNNVRAVQGKEASGTLSKISTIAGVASAVTSAAASFTNFEDADKVVHNSFKAANVLGKMSIIAKAAGALTTGASQIMSEFNIGDKKTAEILGTVGGAINMAASIGQLTAGNKKDLDNKNQDSQQTQNNGDPTNPTDPSDPNKQTDPNKQPEQDNNGDQTDPNKKTDPNNNGNNGQTDGPGQGDGTSDTKKEAPKQPEKTDAKSAENSFTNIVNNGDATSIEIANAAVEVTNTVSDNSSDMDNTVQDTKTESQETQAITDSNTEVEKAKAAKKQEKAEQKEKAKQEKAQRKADKKKELEKAKEAKKQKEMEVERVKKADDAAINNIVENGASEEFAHMDDNKLDDMIEGAIEAGDTKKQQRLEAERQNRQEYREQQAKGGPEAEQAKANQKKLAKETKKNLDTDAKVKNIKENGASEDFAKYDDTQLEELAKSDDYAVASDAKKEIEERKEYKKQMEMLEAHEEKKDDAFEIVSKTAELGTNVMQLFANNQGQNSEQKKKSPVDGSDLLAGYDFKNHKIGGTGSQNDLENYDPNDPRRRRRIRALAGRYMA